MNPQASSLPLRDIHLPEPVSWWPPAPGWWLLPVMVLLVFALAWWLYHRYQRNALQRQAQQNLREIARNYRDSGDERALAQHLSILLRRISISRFPRQQVAGLTGEPWLRWLDRYSAGHEFQKGVGRSLIEAPYAAEVSIDGPALLNLCERWVAQFSAGGARR